MKTEKDLGIVFSSYMKVETQCKEAYCTEASRMLGLINHVIRYQNPTVLVNLYKSLVRPHLEYCSVVWNKGHNFTRMSIQHRFTRLFPDLRDLPYEERLRRLGLWSLEEMHNRADLNKLFKMVKGLTAVLWTSFSTVSRTVQREDTTGS